MEIRFEITMSVYVDTEVSGKRTRRTDKKAKRMGAHVFKSGHIE
jgi:hypothetical protein